MATDFEDFWTNRIAPVPAKFCKNFRAVEKVSARAKPSKNFAKLSEKLSVGAVFDEKQNIDGHIFLSVLFCLNF